MQTLEKNQMMDLSKGNKPIECKWAFTIKYKVDQRIKRYKKDWWQKFITDL